jgi:hypothetical protein
VTAAAHLAEFEAHGPAAVRAHLTEEHRASRLRYTDLADLAVVHRLVHLELKDGDPA